MVQEYATTDESQNCAEIIFGTVTSVPNKVNCVKILTEITEIWPDIFAHFEL